MSGWVVAPNRFLDVVALVMQPQKMAVMAGVAVLVVLAEVGVALGLALYMMDMVLVVAAEVLQAVVSILAEAEAGLEDTRGLREMAAARKLVVHPAALVLVVAVAVVVVVMVTLRQGVVVLVCVGLEVLVLAVQVIHFLALQFVAVMALGVRAAVRTLMAVVMEVVQVQHSVLQIILPEELAAELFGPAQLVNTHQLVHRTYK